MKKLIMVLITVVLVGNCANNQPLDVPEFDSTIDSFIWVRDNIQSINHEDKFDAIFPQHPSKTIRIRNGNAQDKTVLFMNIIHDQFSIDSEFVVISDGFGTEHAVARFDNNYYDIWYNDIYDNADTIIVSIDYENIMLWSEFNK